MSLEDLGNLGEFVGAIAVVASLIYLAVQVRQNTRSVRASTYQAVVSASADINAMIAQDETLARIFRLGLADVSELTDDERMRLDFFLGQWFNMFENLYLQREHGTIDAEFFDAKRDLILRWLSQPGLKKWWNNRSYMYARRFRDFVSENLRD